jgi:hypothetical protein
MLHKIKTQRKTIITLDDEFELQFTPVDDTILVEETPEGWTVKYLVRDDDPMSPREWDDEELFLVNYHRDFDVRNDKVITEEDVRALYLRPRINEIINSGMARGKWLTQEELDEIKEGMRDIPQEENYWFFPLSCYSHSGVSLSLSSHFACDSGGWDTSHVGVVLVGKEFFPTEERAREAAEGLVNEWNEYLSGDVYGVVVETFDKERHPVNEDSCWGYYGQEYAMEELRGR